jgi:hypothetical protein
MHPKHNIVNNCHGRCLPSISARGGSVSGRSVRAAGGGATWKDLSLFFISDSTNCPFLVLAFGVNMEHFDYVLSIGGNHGSAIYD